MAPLLTPRTTVLPRSPATPALGLGFQRVTYLNLRLPEIFSNNASDSDSSTVPSVFDLSSESESKSEEESEDKLASEDKEEPSLLISPSSDRNAIARKPKRDWIRRKIFRIEKKLSLKGRPKATIYIEDIAEFARVILSTIEITFPYS
ncbi:hypothetical protein N7445_006189 [Penicillium cf. griseofulvum]|nr:hypothetical protein N7445_006189 [Penicillium cf. griseofulvum]